MADQIAGAAVEAGVKFVLENLQYHRNLIKGAEGEVRKLEEDLHLFQAFLKVTAKQRLEEDIWRVLVGRIRSVVNDAEDTIDTYVTKAAATNSRNCFGRAFSKPLFLHDIGTQVQSIVEEINTTFGKDKILEWATRNTDEIQRNHGHTKKSEGPRKVKRDNIVGFTDECNKIIGYLQEKTEYLDVISIIGMPGLGKTTFASKVYHHETIQTEFPTRIWVYIAKEFTEEKVFLDILKQLMDLAVEENQKKYKKLQESDWSVLVEEITTHLKDKRFLIVMDDVWTHKDWEKIQKALPMNNHAGKVLITSRKNEVSNAINRHIPSDKLHVLMPALLNKEDSWLLLQYEAFGKPECPIELEDYGEEIVRKCGGLPLAIAIIGGLLGNKFSASDDMAQQKKAWKEVSSSVTTHLYDVDEEKYMKKIIALSYDDLPYHLRACFLYLGMFPEDFEIPAWKLICMWIAEGFIEHKNDLSLEGVAEIYLVELISRNLVKAEKIRSDGRVRTCRIHDMLREFCINEAERKDENFFHEVKRILEEQKCRRICTDHIITSSSLKSLGPRVRTFVCFSKEPVIFPKENNSAIPTDLELLRVLEAESIKLERIPKEMYQLLHLRYLTLSVVNLRVIPETLSKLWNLETFIVHTEDRWEGVEMKADVWKLRQLRHLKTNSAISFPEARKSGGTEGKKLQTLGTISAESCTEEVFNRACNLKELVISGVVNSESFKNLVKLDSLEKLKLFGATDIGIGRLPPDPFPPNLKSLTLGGTGLDWDADIHILGVLENLEVLKLKVGSFTKGQRWKAEDGAFCRLEVLHIDCNCLEVWEASGHHYPRLRHLRLHDIAYSSLKVPMGLADIPNFRVMEFSGYYREEKLVAAKKVEEAKKEKLGEHNVKDGAFKLLLTGKLATRREGATAAMAEAAGPEMMLMLENLQLVVQYRSNLIKGAAHEFRKLKEDLRLFQAFLKKSAKQRLQDNTTRDLVDRIRNVLYKVEHIIDAYVTTVVLADSRNCFPRRAFSKPLYLDHIATRVQPIVEEINRIHGDRILEWAIHKIENDGPTEKQEATVLRQENVVGFEDEAAKIIGYLTETTAQLDVITVIGMPGLGKTTLAGKIYRDEKIQYEFPTRIWVYVSQEFTKKEVYLAILREFTRISDDIDKQTDDELRKLVHAYLEKGKFLIVMDDVWTVEDWNRIKGALPTSNNGGKVLITSRNVEVALHANRQREPHKLRFLTPDESWLLLQLEVFGKPDCPEDLKYLGKIIVDQCDGLPLAIVVIGGILVKEISGSDDMSAKIHAWKEVSNSVSTYLTMDPTRQMEKIIALSYDKLPYHLRACFLYLGMFPEDYEIPVWKLVRMWIAEGFIQQKGDLSMEEIAEDYLNELINRNLVRVDKRRPNGRVKTCRIHDMLRDFCRYEAGGEKENFLQEMKMTSEGFGHRQIAAVEKCRRICTHSNVLDFISTRPFGPHVRSFVCFSKEDLNMPPEYTNAIPAAFKLLRVLDVKPIKFREIPTHMYQLVHLRYITLSFTSAVLPSAFDKLWNLETLFIDTSQRSLDIKADIWKMSQLRHIKTNASATLPKVRKSSKGENLQTLGTIAPQSCTEEVFERACNLKKLGIRGKLSILVDGKSVSFNNLVKLSNLEKLKLLNDVFPSPASDGQLLAFPPPYQFPPKLKSLTLADTFLDWEYMNILGLLENLEVLKLKDKAFQGKFWQAKDGAFRRLEVLHIGRTTLTFWVASAHHFPRLKRLELHNCEELKEVPIGLAEIPSFRSLDLYRSNDAVTSATKILEAKKQILGEQNVKDGAFKLSIFSPPALT